MPALNDPKYLKAEQYRDAGKLEARIRLHERFSTNPYGWFRWVFDQFDLPPFANILEIGCGSGQLWQNNLERIPQGWHITLSDFSPGMIHDAKMNLGINRENYCFEVCDAVGIPFRKGEFNAIIANHMLSHVPDRQAALVEFSRVLKPGGYLYTSTIGENHLIELEQLLNTITRSMNIKYSPAFNPVEFSLENGMQQLMPWFSQIEIHRYEDALCVNEAEPLVDYIQSMIPRENILMDDQQTSKLTRQLEDMIIRQGSIYIQKSSGIFIGRNRGLE